MTKQKKPTTTDPYVTELSDWADEEGRLSVSVADLLDVFDALYLNGMSDSQDDWPPNIEEFGVEDPALIELVKQWVERVNAA